VRKLAYVTAKPRRRRKAPGVIAKARAKRRRAEDPVAKRVRATCIDRDGECRVCDWENNPGDIHIPGDCGDDVDCGDGWNNGPSEWAHLGDGKRARTRGMKPEKRHTTAKSLMLCHLHHDRYDGRQKPRLTIRELTEFGADGLLEFE